MKNIIIIPVYKEQLNEAELISLKQSKKIFKDEILCFIAPYRLKNSNIIKDNVTVVYFDDKYFNSTESYSQLMLSVDFYKKFQSCDYMLIYQLDAFVFSNRLQEFSAYEYDYIGACIPAYYWPYLKHRVGNGGFSLRNIKRCIKLLDFKEKILESASRKFQPNIYNQISTIEDVFFSYCGNQEDIDFVLAPEDVAQDFSVEFEVNGRYGSLNNNLPFGCHRWYQAALDLWWPYIEKMGYTMSKSFMDYCRTRSEVPVDYRLLNLMEKPQYHTIIKKAFNSIICHKKIIIWGFGIRGMRLISLLKILGISPLFIIDSNYSEKKVDDNIVFIPPIYEEINKSDRLTIITPRDKYNEIILQLNTNGVDIDKYCILYKDLIQHITNYIELYNQCN